MAANLLPLIVVGGAAAYLVTSDRKKKEKAKVCPPSTTITLGEMNSVATRANEKFGEGDDPSQEASWFVTQLLPAGCSRASKDSEFKITIPDVEKAWVVSVPDAYMMTFMTSLGGRVGTGKLTKDQAEKFWARELDWYKKTTGKNFDIASLELKELAIHIGDAVVKALAALGIGEGKSPDKPKPTPAPSNGNGSEPPPMGACPASFDWDVGAQEMADLEQAHALGRQLHPNDPFKAADVVFESLVMPGCTKKDYESIVTVRFIPSSGDDPIPMNQMDLAAIYAMFVLDAADRMALGPAKMQAIESKVASNYQQLTGKPLAL